MFHFLYIFLLQSPFSFPFFCLSLLLSFSSIFFSSLFFLVLIFLSLLSISTFLSHPFPPMAAPRGCIRSINAPLDMMHSLATKWGGGGKGRAHFSHFLIIFWTQKDIALSQSPPDFFSWHHHFPLFNSILCSL